MILRSLILGVAVLVSLSVGALAQFQGPISNPVGSYYNGVIQGGSPYVVNVTDARFGAKCDTTELTGFGSTTAGSNTFSVGSPGAALIPLVNQKIVVTGFGHVTGANDLYVNGFKSTINTAGSGYAINNTITLTDLTVLTVDAVSAGAVTAFHVSTYHGDSSASDTLAQSATSGSGTGFILNSAFNGPSYYGTIASVTGSGGGPFTVTVTPGANMNMGVTSGAGHTWAVINDIVYGDDDAAAIASAFTYAQANGTMYVALPGNSNGGCGIASTVALPSGISKTGNYALFVGSGFANSDLYALSPMTSMLTANTGNAVGYGSGIRGMEVNCLGLCTTSVIQMIGMRHWSIDDSWLLNATGSGVVGLLLGNGVTSSPEFNIRNSRFETIANYFAFPQMPDREINITAGATDGEIEFSEVVGGQLDNILVSAADTRLVAVHAFNPGWPNNNPTHGFNIASLGALLVGDTLDNATGTSGYFLNNNVITMAGDFEQCNASPAPSATYIPIEIANGLLNVNVGGTTVAGSCNFTNTNIVQQDGSAGVGTNVFGNSNATLGYLSSNLTLAPPNSSQAAWNTNGVRTIVNAATYTDNSTLVNGTVTGSYVDRINSPTIAAASTGVSYQNTSTLDIEPPVAGTNVTLTGSVAALHLGGNANFGGNSLLSGGLVKSNNASGYQLGSGASTCTAPTLQPNVASTTTGIGGTSGNLAFVVAGVNQMDFGCTVAGTWTIPAQLNINVSANNNVNINTGNSVGTVTVGNSLATITANGAVSINNNINDNTTVNGGTSNGTITIGNSANTGKLTIADLGAGTVANMMCLTSANLAINCTAPGTGQSTVASPTAPNSTAVFKMQGLAGAITPARTGRIYFLISATATSTTTTALDGINIQASWGTGTAPVNNAALTGTQCGSVSEYTNPTTVVAADVHSYIAANCVVTGLTIGTAYWLDLAAESVNTASAVALSNVNISAIEE